MDVDRMPPMKRAAMTDSQDHLHSSSKHWSYQNKGAFSDENDNFRSSPIVVANGTVHSSIEDLDDYEHNYAKPKSFFLPEDNTQISHIELSREFVEFPEESTTDPDPADYLQTMKEVGYVDMSNDIYVNTPNEKGDDSETVFVLNDYTFDRESLVLDVVEYGDGPKESITAVAYVDIHNTCIMSKDESGV